MSLTDPQVKIEATAQLQAALQAVLDRFVEEFPEMQAATMLGVLRIVEHNTIERFTSE